MLQVCTSFKSRTFVSGKVTNAHAAKLKFYKNSSLGITDYVQDAFQCLFNLEEFYIEEPSGTRRAPNVAYEALVQWQGFSESEKS